MKTTLRTRPGFTLIELLVVIAIIAILAAILFPVFAKAREKARQTTCLNNQRQIVIATQMYAQDHDEMLPEAASFWGAISLDKGVLKCPSKSALPNAYVFNNAISGFALGQVDPPQTTLLTADGFHPASEETATYITTFDNVAYEATDYALTRHTNKAIAGYMDGHTDMISTAPTTSGKMKNIPNFANLALWLSASYNVTKNGSNQVTSWADRRGTGSGSTATVNNNPVMTTLNTKPAIQFKIASSTYADTGAISALEGKNTLSWYMLVKQSSTTQGSCMRAAYTGGSTGTRPANMWGFYYGGGGIIGHGATSDGNRIENATGFSASTTTAYLYSAVWNGTTVTTYRNGGSAITGTGTPVAVPTGPLYLRIAAQGGAVSGYGDLDIAEILVFDKAQSDSERQQVESYLMTQYGL